MKGIQKKYTFKKILYSKFIIVLSLFFIYILSRGSYGLYQRYRDSSFRSRQTTEKYLELKDRHQELKDEIEFMASEVGQEYLLRSRNALLKEGERMIIIIDNEEEIIEEEDLNMLQKTKTWFQSLNLLK